MFGTWPTDNVSQPAIVIYYVSRTIKNNDFLPMSHQFVKTVTRLTHIVGDFSGFLFLFDTTAYYLSIFRFILYKTL